jgi:predicted nucleic acid-binding protein
VKSILVDTGVIVALLDRSERHHQRCVEAVDDLTAPLVTCEPVIAEACYLLRSLPDAQQAILVNVERGVFQVPFRLDTETAAVRALLKKYRTQPMDLADACLVCLATRLDTGKILTLDSDYSFYRWGKNRPFENLVDI